MAHAGLGEMLESSMTVAPTRLGRHRAPRREAALVAALGIAVAAIAILLPIDIFRHSSSGSGTVVGSGVPASETRHVPPFDGIELAGSNNVMIRVGNEQSVVVHADDNLVGNITTRVSGGNLVIGHDETNFTTRSPMRVDVTVPAVSELTLSGSGTIAVAGVDAEDLMVTLAGSGVVNATGMADRLEVALAGSGDAQLEELVARRVRAELSGSGRVLVNATESLDASVPGSGAVVYTGDPARVEKSVTGVGSVKPGQ